MKSSFVKFFCIFCFLSLTLVGAVSAKSTAPRTSKKVAVLPFINYSFDSRAVSVIADQLYTQLESHNINYISNTELRPLLRKNRIRSLGSINAEEVAVLLNSIDIDLFLIGSINIFIAQDNPEISISMRILDAKNMHIISAETYSATGLDFEKLFGTGILTSIDSLVNKAVLELVENLFASVVKYETETPIQKQTLAIIPVDNITEQKRCGRIADNILLTTFVQAGYNVIEPGIIQSIMSKNRRVLRGEIDLETLALINNKVQVDMIVTGGVEQYEVKRGSRQPAIEIGLRTLDASNGKIISMFNDFRKGNDSETVFGHGIVNAMGNLLTNSFTNYIQSLDKKSEKYFAKHN